MPFAAAISTHPITALAAGEVIGQLLDGNGRYPDLVVLAASPGHAGALEDVADTVRKLLSPTVLFGGISPAIGAGHNGMSGSPVLAGWSATCGPVAPVRLDAMGEATDPPAFTPQGLLLIAAEEPSGVAWPVAGGLATGPLVLDGELYGDGAVGAAVGPGAELRIETDQGLRPLGPASTADLVKDGLLLVLDGQPALQRLTDLARDGVPAPALAGIGAGLHVSISEPGAPIQLLPVLGMERASGGLAVAAHVGEGSVVQFLVRDPEVLAADRPDRSDAAGALAFGAGGHGDVLVGDDALLPLPTLFLEASRQLSGAGSGFVAHRQATTVALFTES